MKRSRQSYYQSIKRQRKHSQDEDRLLGLVHPIRRLMPRIGGRKLYFMIQGSLVENAIKMGRDRFFRWLRDHDLLISPKRSYARTTQSHHRFWIYDNLTE